MAGGISWPPEAIATLLKMFAEGASDAEIGKAVGRTAGGVSHQRAQRGLFRDRAGLKPGRRKWSRKDLDTLNAMFGEGASDEAIAKALGRTTKAVSFQRQARRMNRPAANGFGAFVSEAAPQSAPVVEPQPVSRDRLHLSLIAASPFGRFITLAEMVAWLDRKAAA